MTTTMKRVCLAVAAGLLLITATVLLILYLPRSTAVASDEAGAGTGAEASAEAIAEAKAVEAAVEMVRDAVFNLEAAIWASIEEERMLSFSSNPYAYINDGRNSSFNTFVEVGPVGLPVLERALMSSSGGGLADYIICIAIEEVSGANVRAITEDPFAWATALDFRSLWPEVRRSAPEKILGILAANGLSNQEKMERISAYGLLAVPVIKDALLQGGLDESLVALLNDYVAERPLTDYEMSALR